MGETKGMTQTKEWRIKPKIKETKNTCDQKLN